MDYLTCIFVLSLTFAVCLAEELSLKPVTNWVIADLANKEGRSLVKAALEQMVTGRFSNLSNVISALFCLRIIMRVLENPDTFLSVLTDTNAKLIVIFPHMFFRLGLAGCIICDQLKLVPTLLYFQNGRLVFEAFKSLTSLYRQQPLLPRTGEFNAGGNPGMDWHPIQRGLEILLVASCYRNRG